MIIGVISDTHVPSRLPRLPRKVLECFQDVDLILHAGDIEHPQVIMELETVAPVVAVAGNMDEPSPQLPVSRLLTLEGRRVGLMHGYGGPRPQIRDWVRKQFQNPDIIIYGHTHAAFWGEEAGVWFMNPGSPLPGSEFASVGILKLDQATVRGDIIRW